MRIFVYEDDPMSAEMLRDSLLAYLPNVHIDLATTYKEMLKYYENNHYDVAILDWNLDFHKGERLHANDIDPFIVAEKKIIISAAPNGSDGQMYALEKGYDFYPKPIRIKSMINSIERRRAVR